MVVESQYQPRVLETQMRDYLQCFSVLVITGPRQSGKSTLIQQVLKDYQYVSFDDFRVRSFLHDDPIGFMETYRDKVIFDEAQKVPMIFELVKIAVDNDRKRYGKFVLAGSSQFPLLKKISESLAGRVGLLTLLPFQYSELPPKIADQAIYRGSYPEVVQSHYHHRLHWYSAYIETYLNKDVREIKEIGNLRDFRRFVNLLAANATQILNMSAYANDLGVSVPTIKSWLSVLEASYVIFLLPPYYQNYGKRTIKSPKVYFYDTGIISYLTAIDTDEQYQKGPMAGPLFENYIVSEILKKESHTNTHAQLYYYRASNGLEIDLIVDRKPHRALIEIKKNKSFSPRMTKPIETIAQEGDRGYLLYDGEAFTYKKNIWVMDYRAYLS